MPLSTAERAALAAVPAGTINASTAPVVQARLAYELLIEQIDTSDKLEASLVRQEAAWTEQNAQLKRIADAQEKAAQVAPSKAQQLWLDLYRLHLTTRREPAVITSATADLVVQDIVKDAVMMTAAVFPDVRATLRGLDGNPTSWD